MPPHFLKHAIAAEFWHRHSWAWVSLSGRAFRAGTAAIKYSRFVTRAFDQCTFAVRVPWRVMCHSESWQKSEDEVDELHDVDKDQKTASSLKGAEN